MTTKPNPFTKLAKSPILWGGLASFAFYLLMAVVTRLQQALGDTVAGNVLAQVTTIHRDYLAGHPIEYATTILFFIGLAMLVIRILELASQPRPNARAELLLGPIVHGGHSVETVPALVSRLDTLRGRHNPMLVRRLREAMDRVRRRGSANRLEDDLIYLADREEDRLHDSYALFRVVIWAIPILGFLGTVVGIIMAISELSPTKIDESMPKVIAALSVAFATTAQSLSMSIVLMFGKYQVGQAEGRLLAEVDRRADDELLGRFEQIAPGPEGQLTAVRHMSETMIDACEHLVARQTELWQKSIDAAAERWLRLATEAEAHLGKAMAVALGDALRTHAATLATAEEQSAARSQKQWQSTQEVLARTVEAAASLQARLNDQTDVLRRTVEATGQVAKLEETLNRNLATLAGAKHFEQTVNSLAAAIHLLNAHLEDTPDPRAEVKLQPKKVSGQAA